MIEMAARTGRLETPGFNAPFYTWEITGKPVSVELPLAMIDRLESEAVENFRSLSSRGSEIGGVLFGIVKPGAPAQVTLVSYELVACDYSRGPLYRLSEPDLARLDGAIAQGTSSGLAAVGFFRSHTRRGMSLDADDRKLLDLRFAKPHCLAMLIRPYAAKPSTAGIFIWENGEMQMETSHLEFPFRSAELAKWGHRAAVSTPRAQIVPIASRREPVIESAPAGLAAPIPAAIPNIEPATRVSARVAPAAPIQAAAPVAIPNIGPVLGTVAHIAAVTPISTTPVGVGDIEPATLPAKPAMAQNRRSRLPVYISGLVAAATVGVFTYIGMQRSNSAPPARKSTLALRVERTGRELLLTWDRDSEAIRSASLVILEISDGPQRENVELDLAQLRNGSIVYSPATADVVFRMDVIGPVGAQTASESVRVLSTRPSSLAAGAPAHQKPVTAVAVPEMNTPQKDEPGETVAIERPTRPFHADSLAQRLRPAVSQELPDAPTVAATSEPTPALPAFPQAAVAPPPAIVEPPQAPAEQPLAKGGQVVQAQLIQRVDPAYPKIARDSGAKGLVKLSATIGVDGRVKSVKPLGGHPLLIRVASDAVMQWVYRPTMLNGSPVETQSEIVLNFAADR